jgi:hypothetical protein
MISDKKRVGLILMIIGAILIILPNLMSLVNGIVSYGFGHSLFIFHLMSFIVVLLIVTLLIKYTAMSPFKGSRITLVLVGLVLVANLGIFLSNTDVYIQKVGLLVSFILGMAGYALVFGGSFMVLRNAKSTDSAS